MHLLPTEFFNHQIMDVDPANEESVFTFISKWGVPLSPYRRYSVFKGDRSYARHSEAINITEYSREFFDMFDVIFSFDETVSSISFFQSIVKDLRRYVIGEAADIDLSLILDSTYYPYDIILNNRRLRDRLSPTWAISNQTINTIADDAPWRRCACVGCERVFKRKQTDTSVRPSSSSVYCCKVCEEKQKKRNQRQSAKNRIRH